MGIQCIVFQDVFSSMYYAHLLGGEFSNCYGQGQTEEQSIQSLKLRIHQLKRIKNVR